MKKLVFYTVVNSSIILGQFSYPAEDFLGGGIGYSPMYIKLKEMKSFQNTVVSAPLPPN